MKSKILQTLQRDHANQTQLLKLIEREIGKLDHKQSTASYELIALALEYCADYPSHYHHPKEDILYARLAKRAPEVAKRTVVLTEDHATLNTLTREFAAALADAIAGDNSNNLNNLKSAGELFLAHYRRHINIEESEVFPLASEILTQEDWSEIENALEEAADPLFGEHTRQAYLSLQQRIVEREKSQKRTEALAEFRHAG